MNSEGRAANVGAGPGALRWRLRLLGACELLAPDGAMVQPTQRKALALLAYVERQRERRVMRERLATLLWDHADNAQARLNLRKTLSIIRQETGRHAPLTIQTFNDMVAIDEAELTSDVHVFEAALQDRPADLDRLRAAAEFYRGDFLSGFVVRNAAEFDHWVLVERQRLRELAIGVFCQIMDHEEEQAEARAAAALRVLAMDPLQEPAHRALMRQLARQGRYSAALKHYHGLVDLLARELGSPPEMATQQLFRDISQSRQSRGENSASAPVAIVTSAEAAVDRNNLDEDISRAVPASPLPGHSPRKWRRILLSVLAVGAVVLVAAGFVIWRGTTTSGADTGHATQQLASAQSVAVLPFSTFGVERETGLFADGLTEEIINSLVQLSSLQVTGRTSSFHFKGRNLDLREIGRRLGVAYIVEGSVRQTGNRLRVTAQLISVEDGFHLWSKTYDRTLKDVFAIQENIADSVASELEARLAAVPSQAHLRFSEENYHSYLLALSHLRSRRADDLQAARALFDRLRQAEPRNAYAHTGYVMATLKLERAWRSIGFETARVEAEKSVHQALAAAPDLSDAHLARGLLAQFLAINSSSSGQADQAAVAEAALRRAVQLNPRSASALAAYGEQLGFMRRPAEAVDYLKRAVDLDPLATDPKLHLSEAYESLGQSDRALAGYRSILAYNSSFAPAKYRLGRLLMRQGKLDQAEAWLRESHAIDGNPGAGMWLANLYLNLGMEDRARAIFGSMSTAGFLPEVQGFNLARSARYREWLRQSEEQMARDPDPLWLCRAFTAATLLGDNSKALRYLGQMAPGLLKAAPIVDPAALYQAALGAYVLKINGDSVQAERILRAVIAFTDRSGSVGVEDLVWRAAAFAQLGDLARASKELQRVAAMGYRTPIDRDNFIHISRYPMFRQLKDDRGFQNALAVIERDLRRMRASIEQRPAAGSTPTI